MVERCQNTVNHNLQFAGHCLIGTRASELKHVLPTKYKTKNRALASGS